MAKKPAPKDDDKKDDDACCYEVGDTYCCSAGCGMEVTIAKTCDSPLEEPCLECCEKPMVKKS